MQPEMVFLFVCKKNWLMKKIDEYMTAKGVDVVRVIATMACTDCKQRNYTTEKNKRTNTERLEMKKFCKFCNAHTLHRETK